MNKRIWIPVILMTGIATGITFWHQHIPRQEPTNQSRQDGYGQTRIPDLYVPLGTAEDVRKYMNRVRGEYVRRHCNEYPKCRAYTALLADAERYAEWYIADLEYIKMTDEARAKWGTERDALWEALIQGEVFPRDYTERFQRWESLTITEKSDLIAEHIARVYSWLKKYETASKRLEEIKQQRPIFQPKHRH